MNKATRNDSWVQNPDGTLGYTCSLITGCDRRCPWCFAWKQANGRLRSRYLANKNCAPVLKPPMHYIPSLKNQADPFYPRFWSDRLEKLDHFLASRQKPTGVFLNIMGEAFGDWVPESWQNWTMEVIRRHSKHRIYLLTHQPQNLVPWSPFPDNCWVGATVNTNADMTIALTSLPEVDAEVVFLSFEPLIGSIGMRDHMNMKGIVDWVIIGAMTGTKGDILKMNLKYLGMTPMPWGGHWTLQPKIEWVEDIAIAAGQAGIPVFLKENLKPLLYHWDIVDRSPRLFIETDSSADLKQEMPI